MAVSVRERVHELVDTLSERDLIAVDRYLRFIRQKGPQTPLEIRAAHPLPEPERQAHVKALRGKYAGKLSTLEEFSRMRQEEIELEERRWTPEYKGLTQ